jgi:hypothetical protein
LASPSIPAKRPDQPPLVAPGRRGYG